MSKGFTSARTRALRTLFDRFDTDGSGELDPTETRQMLQEMGLDPTDDDIIRVMSRADENGNMKIGFDEFAAGCLDVSDSNVYTGIKRKTEGGLDESTFLDLRKKRSASRNVWTKQDIERNLNNQSSDKPAASSADDAQTRADNRKEVEQQKKLVKDLEAQLKAAREKLQKLEADLDAQATPADQLTHSSQDMQVPALLNGVLKITEQANMIATGLEKDAHFVPRIFKEPKTGENIIEVNMKTKQGSYFWTLDKFNERFAEMLNMWDDYKQCRADGVEWNDDRPQELDPFYDTEYQLAGTATAWLKSLGNMMESTVTAAILNLLGTKVGEMVISINPCDEIGNEGPWEDDDDLDPFVDAPDDLLDTEIWFKIRIPEVRFAGQDGEMVYDNTYIRYKFNENDNQEVFTRSDKSVNTSNGSLVHRFDFIEDHKVIVDKEVLDHILNGKIVFELWGRLIATTGDGDSNVQGHPQPL